MNLDSDTIAAIATPPGKGGVGIIRISGNQAQTVAKQILGFKPRNRYAHHASFEDDQGRVIDEGIALYFKGPNSFTGEDVLELQGHGGPIVLDQLLKEILKKDVRLAHPGEFSQRAYLNNKMDLTQAEAIADLINASSEQAARNAVQSLQGTFSKKINELLKELIHLRKMVEAAIDFPEEEIDFLEESSIKQDLKNIIYKVSDVLSSAQQGVLLQEGMTVVLAGEPNVGKSSLLNCLSGKESAIVTEIAGTTRDILKEYISIDGMPLHIIDTAGLRDSEDIVEQEGMRRALRAIEEADAILWIKDVTQKTNYKFPNALPKKIPVIVVKNKVDLIEESPRIDVEDDSTTIHVSAKQQLGIDLLKKHLKQLMGYVPNQEGIFIARRRHVDALQRVLDILKQGKLQLQQHRAGELLAEDLKLAQQTLSEVTGVYTSDDLLGEIFSNFCIGK